MVYPTPEHLRYCSLAFTPTPIPTPSSSSSSLTSANITSTTLSAYLEQQRFEARYSTAHALYLRREWGEAAYQAELHHLEACALRKAKARRARQSKWLGVQIKCEEERSSVRKGWMRVKALFEILYLMADTE